MDYFNARTFNPELLYIFDPWNEPGAASKMHHHDFLEISLVLEGEAHYQFEKMNPLTLHAGNILLFNPGYRHAERQTEGTCSHQLHIGIRNISLEGLSRNHFPNQRPLLDLGKYQHQVMEKAWLLTREIAEKQNEFQVMQKALVMEMLVLILRGLEEKHNNLTSYLSKKEKRQQQIVNYTIYFLENHYEEEITLEKLAQDQYISATYLSKIFKEATGMSPINYLITIRLSRAKELLKNDKLSIKEVATTVGYQDAFHFSKSFKKQFGTAPSNVVQEKNEEIPN
ncbi:AraC family transcriptional regulator [Enterococcus massiliensis]|uniref:AraC family transcriptional regulator n=1 Tax=Enterococcus massiliensis TaxID=1640685 RepID=UPI00065E039B|nr:AraC family transcriptional regulator [Enterococcus massiliensis]